LSGHLTNTQIEDYSRHKLSAAELLSVSRHLGVCEACSRQVEKRWGSDAAFFTLKSEVLAEMLSSPAVRTHLTPKQAAGYVDEALAGEELQAVKDHLTACDQCEIAVSDMRTFREQVASGLDREYQPSAIVAGTSRRRFVAALSSFLPRPPALIFGSAFTALLLILAGWLVWQALQGKETEIVETPSASPIPTVTPVVSPAPRLEDVPAAVLVQLNDGGGQVTLDQKGNLSGIDNLPSAYLQMIKAALTNQQLEKSQLLAGLTRPGDSQIRARDNQGGEFSTIKPVGTVILSDRPTFHWSRLDGAMGYVVEVYDDDFTKAATSTQLIDNSWTVPKSLPRGRIYIWQVKAIKDGQKEFLSPRPNKMMAKFRILDQARADDLKRARRIYAGSHLTLGMLYARDGLLDEAEQELHALQKANPNSAIARRLLANVQAMRG
jgi:anti-sigma factor RsiW